MNVGIMVYSQTGNTLSVAEKLRDACREQGNTVTLERITVENDTPNSKQPPKLISVPDPNNYDCVIFAAPVHAFSLCPAMKAYLAQLPRMGRKKVGCFVTQQFPKPWMGGKHAVRQMRSLCRDKGSDAAVTGIVNWSNKTREQQIDALVADFGKMAMAVR